MVDPGDVFRKALSWLPPNFVSVDPAAANTPRQFSSTDHLSIEAVAAYVDGELPMKAHLRAGSHLAVCRQCAAEVEGQSQARVALRDSGPVAVPKALMGLLAQIPESSPDQPSPDQPPPDQRTGNLRSAPDQVPTSAPNGGTPWGRRKRR